MNQNTLKKQAAQAALDLIEDNMIIGIGTGSTIHFLIEALAQVKPIIQGAVPSSIETEKKLKAQQIPIFDLNAVNQVDLYIDSADQFNEHKQLIKGGGGALTREKILACAANRFICIVDETKKTKLLSNHPVPLEVIPMARSLVARRVITLGAQPVYRDHVRTDNGNIILDLHHLNLSDPAAIETTLKTITGVVESGLFAKRKPDLILISTNQGMIQL